MAMAEAMKFDLVSPEKKFASMDVTMVQIPGADGDLTAMHNHAPTVISLRPGILRAVGTKGEIEEFVVAGGFAEISPEATSILAERSVKKADANAEFVDAELKAAEVALSQAGDDAAKKAAAELALGDVKHLRTLLGM